MGASGFGSKFVSGRRRVPKPAAKIIAPVLRSLLPAMPSHSRRPRVARQLSILAAAALLALATPSCSDDAASRSTCEAVERARCAEPQCLVVGAAFGTAEDCSSYAVDACRGGTTSGVSASADRLRACTEAIAIAGRAGNCQAVRTPSSLSECAFLLPTNSDAGRD